jgi:hypothetical protein
MNGEQRGNWWKAAASDQQHDAMFKKLMDQYGQREDQANQMLGLLLSDRAPRWFVDRLESWVVAARDIPKDHWTMKWIAHQLQGPEDEANDLRKMVKFVGFTGITHEYWDWMKNWCDGLAPDTEPAWFGDEVIRYLGRYKNLPVFAYRWGEAKLEKGQEDGVRRALQETIEHHLNKVKSYSSRLGPESMDWGAQLIPSWGRNYVKKMIQDDLRDGGGQS